MLHHISRAVGREIEIFCFGDLQSDAEGFDREAWEEFRNQFKKSKNALALGLGDYNDFSRPTMRARMLGALAHDDSTRQQVDDLVRKKQDGLLDMMQFLEGKLIGVHNGHHCWEFADRTNSDQRIASALKAPYLGWMASTRLVLSPTKDMDRGYAYTIISMHGQANSRRTGGAANWLEQNVIESWVADHYVMGHSCKSISWMPGERHIIRKKGPAGVISSTPRALQVGGFHRGYTDGFTSSYVERNGFKPQPIMWGVIRLRIENSKSAALARGVARKSPCLRIESLNVGPDIQASQFEGDWGPK